MSKRVRSKEHKAHVAKSGRTKRKSYREEFGKQAWNARRPMELELDQLDYLWQQIPSFEASDKCHEMLSNLNPKGYPTVRFTRNVGMKLPSSMRPDARFAAGAIVLICNGQMPADAKMDCSHLCANPACVNIRHLVWESRASNLARIDCTGQIECGCGCGAAKNFCPHTPPCIKHRTLLP